MQQPMAQLPLPHRSTQAWRRSPPPRCSRLPAPSPSFRQSSVPLRGCASPRNREESILAYGRFHPGSVCRHPGGGGLRVHIDKLCIPLDPTLQAIPFRTHSCYHTEFLPWLSACPQTLLSLRPLCPLLLRWPTAGHSLGLSCDILLSRSHPHPTPHSQEPLFCMSPLEH